MHDIEPKARAFAHSFGGEERIECESAARPLTASTALMIQICPNLVHSLQLAQIRSNGMVDARASPASATAASRRRPERVLVGDSLESAIFAAALHPAHDGLKHTR